MKYGVGQKVRIKDFSELADKYGISNGGVVIGDYFFEREQKVYCGEEYRVHNCFNDRTYELATGDTEGWLFHEEVLELPNAKVKEIDDKDLKELHNIIQQLKKENEQLKMQLQEKEPIIDDIKDDINKSKRTYKKKNAIL